MTTSRILGNFASAFFFASGCWTDLFLIRVFCSCAYICIIAFHFSIQSQEYEMYVWGFLSLYLHGSSAIRLMLEESPVKLDKNQELLWCYLYRHSGISRLLFKRYIANRFELCDFQKVRCFSIYILSSIVYIFLELKNCLNTFIIGDEAGHQFVFLHYSRWSCQNRFYSIWDIS